jgi:hypothetical protein
VRDYELGLEWQPYIWIYGNMGHRWQNFWR